MVEFRIGIRIYRNFVNSYISTPTGIPIMTLYRRKLPNPTRNRIFYPIYRNQTKSVFLILNNKNDNINNADLSISSFRLFFSLSLLLFILTIVLYEFIYFPNVPALLFLHFLVFFKSNLTNFPLFGIFAKQFLHAGTNGLPFSSCFSRFSS